MIFSETELQSRSQHPGFVGGENLPGQGELNFTHSRKVAGVNGWAGRGVGPALLAYGLSRGDARYVHENAAENFCFS